jgi:hypothetical protein|tara:strand:- start:93 stop:260 length:168 start_codon:yes stop_codon:yes gene_type:complete
VSVVGTCPGCGGKVTAADGRQARSQKIPWHFWVFVSAAFVYLGWRLVQGIGSLLT